MNFYFGQEKILKVGWDDEEAKYLGERVESFEIAIDEQLIGAELYYSQSSF
jgi:hypothetical protein